MRHTAGKSYDFVEAQTHDGHRIRLMTLIDELPLS
jgi:hypothetical protein